MAPVSLYVAGALANSPRSSMKLDRPFSLFACVALLSALACDHPKETVTIIEDTGSICLTQVGPEVSIAAVLDACDGSCNRIRQASCEATVTTDGVVVSSRVEQVREPDKGQNCTTGCSPAGADCAFAAPGDGPVHISFGAEEATINLPLISPTQLFGSYMPCEYDH
jgi:hypothetical protein